MKNLRLIIGLAVMIFAAGVVPAGFAGDKTPPAENKKTPVEKPKQRPSPRLLDFRDLLKRWDQLSHEKRIELQKRFEHFMELPPGQRKKLTENYNKFLGLSPEQQEKIIQRYRQLARLNKTQQARLTRAYRRWKTFEAEKQRRIKTLWNELKQNLPADLARLRRLSKRKDKAGELQKHLEAAARRLKTLRGLGQSEREKLQKMKPAQRQKYLNGLSEK